jgi:hypothetical protein
LIFAPFCASSANDTRMLDSLCAMLPPYSVAYCKIFESFAITL